MDDDFKSFIKDMLDGKKTPPPPPPPPQIVIHQQAPPRRPFPTKSVVLFLVLVGIAAYVYMPKDIKLPLEQPIPVGTFEIGVMPASLPQRTNRCIVPTGPHANKAQRTEQTNDMVAYFISTDEKSYMIPFVYLSSWDPRCP